MKKILFLLCMVLGVTSSAWADDATFDYANTTDGVSATHDPITVTAAKGTATNSPTKYTTRSPYHIRLNANNTLTVSAAEGYAITKVVFTATGTSYDATKLTYTGDNDTKTVAANTTEFSTARESVVFTASAAARFKTIVVTYEATSSVKKPTFSLAAGEYYGAQKVTLSHETAGAAIQYSFDGTDFSDYTAGTEIPVTKSCTLYAKATFESETSAVAKAAYTINPVYASLAELVAAGEPSVFGQKCQVTLTNEKIQNIGWNASYTKRVNVNLKSGDNTVQLYKSGSYVDDTWKKDGTLSGTMQGTYLLYGETWQFLPTNGFADLTYADPVYPFTATDSKGNTVNAKFYNSPLQVKYNESADGLTFKVNGEDATYDATNGLTVTAVTDSKTNDTFTVQAYNGETLVTEQTFTWIPTVTTISSYKELADGTEAILNCTSGKVTYISTSGTEVYLEDDSKAIKCYNLGFTTTPTAYRTISACNIWGVKNTNLNVAVIFRCDETSTEGNCTLTETETVATPTETTLANTLTADYMQRYVILKGLLITKSGSTYKATSGSDAVNIVYNRTTVGTLTATSFADLTCLVTDNGAGTVQLTPTIAPENASDKTSGTCGTVTWTLSTDGSMVFAPTDGESGTLATIGSDDSNRPWANYISTVKTVSFDAGVATNADPSYLFKNMTNATSIDITNLNTSAASSIDGLFMNCSSLKSLDLSKFSTASVNSAKNVFGETCKPTTLKLSKNFGKYGMTGTSYVALPALKYVYTEDATQTFDLTDAQGTGLTDLYTYNESLADYGTYLNADAAATANLYVRSDMGYATFCAPFAVTVPEDVEAYTASVVDNSWVKLTALEDPTVIPAGTAVILAGAKSGDVVKNLAGIATTTAKTVWSDDLVGNLAAKTETVYVPATDYILQCNNNVTGWYEVSAANTIKIGTNRCYMVKPAVVPGAARAFYPMGFDGQTTAINNIASEAQTKTDGKYLVNGRIIAVKAGKAYNMNGTLVK